MIYILPIEFFIKIFSIKTIEWNTLILYIKWMNNQKLNQN